MPLLYNKQVGSRTHETDAVFQISDYRIGKSSFAIWVSEKSNFSNGVLRMSSTHFTNLLNTTSLQGSKTLSVKGRW